MRGRQVWCCYSDSLRFEAEPDACRVADDGPGGADEVLELDDWLQRPSWQQQVLCKGHGVKVWFSGAQSTSSASEPSAASAKCKRSAVSAPWRNPTSRGSGRARRRRNAGRCAGSEWRDGADGWRGAVPLWRAPPLIKDADKSIQIESRADRTDRHNSPTTTDDYEPQELRRRRMA